MWYIDKKDITKNECTEEIPTFSVFSVLRTEVSHRLTCFKRHRQNSLCLTKGFRGLIQRSFMTSLPLIMIFSAKNSPFVILSIFQTASILAPPFILLMNAFLDF